MDIFNVVIYKCNIFIDLFTCFELKDSNNPKNESLLCYHLFFINIIV